MLVNGISDAYVSLDESTTSVIAFDELNGTVQMQFTGDSPELFPGDIIPVDVDTMGYLRKIVKVNDDDGILTIETVQAYLNDVFVNKEVKLNTSLMEPGVTLKSTSSSREISKALTDDQGYIHPLEIIYHDNEGQLRLKSALKINGKEEEPVKIIDFNRDLASDLYGKENDDIHFYIDEGHVSLSSDAIFEFDFTYEGELTEDTKVKKGDVNSFKFYFDSEADFLAKLALDMSKSYEKDNVKKLVDLQKVTAKFFVGPVPVWITFDCDIFGSYHFNADASLHADWGFESNHSLQIGGVYNRQSDIYTPLKEYTPINTVYPLNIEGELNASARLELYPRIEVKFYSIFGPFAEIVPFVEGNYNASLQSQFTLNGTESFLAWNSGIDLGLDFRTGTELSFLGLINKEFGPTTANCFDLPLWNSPTNIELLTTLPGEEDGGKVQNLKFKVTDLLDLPVPLCPVYIEGDGSFSKQILLTDTNGEATLDWTLPTAEGKAEFTSSIYKADRTVVKEITGSLNVRGGGTGETGTFTDSRDGHTYKWVKIGEQVWMAENLAYLPTVGPPSNESYTEPYYYVYGYNGSDVSVAKQQANYAEYGVLYNWSAAKSACPIGWHLPTDDEWITLENNLITNGFNFDGTTTGNKIAKSMAATTNWNSSSDIGAIGNDLSLNNKSGFSALPGGIRSSSGTFDHIGGHGFWWSITEYSSYVAWSRNLSYIYVGSSKYHKGKESGFSVRCIKD